MIIEVQDCGSDFIDYHVLTEFQGNFKVRNQEDIVRVKDSIKKHGFSFPMYVWKNEDKHFVIDGHGRLAALKSLEEDGYEIPKIPFVYIYAENVQEAIRVLILCNSRFGYITNESANDFMNNDDFSELKADLNFDDVSSLFSKDVIQRPQQNIVICPRCGERVEV